MGRKIRSNDPNIEQLNKKKKRLLAIIYASSFVIIAILTICTILELDFVYLSLIAIILLVALLVIILALKSRVTFYAMQYRYYLLLEVSEKAYTVKENFDRKLIQKFNDDGFAYFYKSDLFDVLFRLSKSVEKTVFSNNHLLEIITIIKDNKIDFYSDLINEEYKKIWIEYQRKNRISKQVIVQFKKYEKIDEDIKNDLDRIICYREGKNHLVTINCGYFANNKSIYFLHSNSFFPNLYYKHGCDIIKKYIG